MKGGGRFHSHSQFDPATQRPGRVQTATCGKCGAKADVRDAGERSRPVSSVAEILRRRGWIVASRAVGDRCPACATAAAPTSGRTRPAADLSPAQKRAAWCRIEGVARAQAKPPTVKPEPEPAMPKADPPREPSREDRATIHDALSAAWSPGGKCYADDGSDERLAAVLNVPRAWVAEVRVLFFGDHDRNQAQAEGREQLADFDRRAAALEERGLALATEAEALRREIARVRGKLGVAA